MTMISVRSTKNRLSVTHREQLAMNLTDVVLTVETGKFNEHARVGFQVYFDEFETDNIALAGVLISKSGVDAIHVDITVMDGDWPIEDRAQIIKNVYQVLCETLNIDEPSPAWWITFRIIEEGSWGARGKVTSILDLLKSGVFTPEKAKAIEQNINSK